MPNRYICSVFDEMRECYDQYNFVTLRHLIDEANTLASRMEAHLADAHSIEYLQDEKRELKREIKALKREKAEVEESDD